MILLRSYTVSKLVDKSVGCQVSFTAISRAIKDNNPLIPKDWSNRRRTTPYASLAIKNKEYLFSETVRKVHGTSTSTKVRTRTA